MSVFGKSAGIKSAALLKINPYLGFYQGFLELNMLKQKIFGRLFLLLISQGVSRAHTAITTI